MFNDPARRIEGVLVASPLYFNEDINMSTCLGATRNVGDEDKEGRAAHTQPVHK